MTPINVKFKVEKETKGTIKYQEVGDDGMPAFAPAIGTLYVKKSNFPDGKFPPALNVSITAGA